MKEPLKIVFEALQTQQEPNTMYLLIPKGDWILLADDSRNYFFTQNPSLPNGIPMNLDGEK